MPSPHYRLCCTQTQFLTPNAILFPFVVTIQHDINLRSQELSENKKKEKIKSALTKRKREEREAVESGKNPFYLKVCVFRISLLDCASVGVLCGNNQRVSCSAKTRRSSNCKPSSKICARAASCRSSWPRRERKTPAKITVGYQPNERRKLDGRVCAVRYGKSTFFIVALFVSAK